MLWWQEEESPWVLKDESLLSPLQEYLKGVRSFNNVLLALISAVFFKYMLFLPFVNTVFPSLPYLCVNIFTSVSL